MHFLHPEFFWLAPLVAAPIIIHLLSRLRYRRVRWAAIEFLLTSERKAVRRARLQQILLMILRTLVLAAVLFALLQPILRGGVGRLLGGGNRVAVLLDTSASMSAGSAAGSAFDRSRQMAVNMVNAFPRGTSVAVGFMGGEGEMASREPLRDRDTVTESIKSVHRTDGSSNIPRSLRLAADSLQRTGGGGTIWLLTDGQAGDWHAADTGLWKATREALVAAGNPIVVVTQMESNVVAGNFSVAGITLAPAVPVEGDSPHLTAMIELRGTSGGVVNVSLNFDGNPVDSGSVSFSEPGRAPAVFRLPKLKNGVHSGYVELSPDAIPADNRYYFTINTEERVRVLVVDGAPGASPLVAASHYVALALQPPETDNGERSPFSVKTVEPTALTEQPLEDYEAVIVTDLPSLAEPLATRLNDYVKAGGLLAIFPGPHSDPTAWKADTFPGMTLSPLIEMPPTKLERVTWVSEKDPLTARLPAEGLDRLLIARLYPLEAGTAGQILASTGAGQGFLAFRAVGKGRVYLFGVSAQFDFSNLPFTPIFLPTLYRMVLDHIVEKGSATVRTAYMSLTAPALVDWPHMLTPDQRVAPLTPLEGDSGKATFNGTSAAGVYRLTAAALGAPPVPGRDDIGPIVGAINVPSEESELDKVSEAVVRNLLQGSRVAFMPAEGTLAGPRQEDAGGATSFPFAALGFASLLAAVALAWHMSRPTLMEPLDEKKRG